MSQLTQKRKVPERLEIYSVKVGNMMEAHFLTLALKINELIDYLSTEEESRPYQSRDDEAFHIIENGFPHQPEKEWEKRFDERFSDDLQDDASAIFRVKSFISSEKEQSGKEGHKRGFNESREMERERILGIIEGRKLEIPAFPKDYVGQTYNQALSDISEDINKQ